MSRFRNSLAAGLGALLCTCSLISFDRLTVTVWPRDRDAIIEAGASPWVEFPDPPDRLSVQRLFSLSGPDGQLSGDFRWEGLRMCFDAVPQLRPGVRHVLTFRGRVTLENGQSFDTNEEVPFYVRHSGPGPALLSAEPSDGGIAGITQPLVLRFSARIDPNSFARELDLQPSTETVVTWDLSDLTASVSPKDAWANLTTYSWKIGKDLAGFDGTPTGFEYSGRFRVQQDSTAPAVLSVVPAVPGVFTPTGNDLDHTGANDALLITYSEDIRQETLSSAFSLTPATRGAWFRVGSGAFAFVPESRWVMAQLYTLQISATVEDLAGNKQTFPFERTFTPNIPLQDVQSITAVYAAREDEWTAFNSIDAKQIVVDADGILRLVIRFAQPFSAEAGAKLVSAIVFDSWFPSSLADPSLMSAFWTGGTTLSLVYTGLQKSEPEIGKYYKLILPGGSASSDNGSGSFLKEDVWLYFITAQ